MRRRHRGRRGAAARQPARLRRPLVWLLRLDRGADAARAGADRGRDPRPRRPARIRADAPDPRAAHPARARDLEHLHLAGAERARGGDLSLVAGTPGDRRARRADDPADRVRARAARLRRGRDARALAAGGAGVRGAARRPARAGDRPLPPAGNQPGLSARTRLPRARGLPARRDHRTADARRHRPAGRNTGHGGGRGAARGRGGEGMKSFIAAADDELTIFERSKPGRRAFVAPALDVPARPLDELLPPALRRAEGPRLPEVSEPEIVRHYNRLSKRNFDLDTGFYPLGSCTMKHNPKLHERLAALPGHAKLHPLQDPAMAQGALELMWRLQQALAEIAGLPHVSLQPSAGSHGELAGVLLTRAFHEDRGEARAKVLTPDTAHGTNPATVTMAGYEVVKVGTDRHGNVDLDDLRAKADEDVACLMLTNPSTLGLFDPDIEEIARIVHGVGATLYYDGANLNAIMGRARPGDMGFDIVHFNLHKTFTQPHGGGGPGS